MSSPAASGCPHSPRPHTICRHLLEPVSESADPPGYQLAFEGSEYRPVCGRCASDSAELVACCDPCRVPFLQADTFGAFDGFLGTPAPRTRDAGLALVAESVDVRGALRDRVLAMAPVARSGRARWVLWTASRRVTVIELPSGEILSRSAPVPVELLPEPLTERTYGRLPHTSLQVSPDGRWTALFAQTTRHGVVVETATGARVLTLDRGDYHPEVSEWPFAFFERDGRTIAVHAIAWNQLAATDVESGADVTPPETPERAPDYFHGRLSISPGGTWIASAGWVWQPVGIVRVMRLDHWLAGKRTPGETNALSLNQTGYHWDGPSLWLDDGHLLVWGLGDDDQRMVDAALIHHVGTGTITGWWPGIAQAPLFADPPNGHVYACAHDGTSVWDAATGERLCEAPGLNAAAFHPAGHVAGIADPEGRFSLGFLQRKP